MVGEIPIGADGKGSYQQLPEHSSSSVPTETVIFRRNQTFIDPPSRESDQAWENLIPGAGPAHGYIAIDNPEQYDLPPGVKSGPNTQNYGVSMYHQLHCLISVRDIFWGVLTGKYDASEFGQKDADGRDTMLTMRVNGHTNHCFDYLRQGIQCAGDYSIEGVHDGIGTAVTGWDMAHTCKSWDKAWQFTEQHQPAEKFTSFADRLKAAMSHNDSS